MTEPWGRVKSVEWSFGPQAYLWASILLLVPERGPWAPPALMSLKLALRPCAYPDPQRDKTRQKF